MAIYVNLNIVMAHRRISTLDAICKAPGCQPGDILEYREEESV